MNHLLEICSTLKRLQYTPPTAVRQQAREEEAGGSAVSPPSLVGNLICSEHAGEELKLYCHTCDTLICCQCAIKDSRHHAHDYAHIKDAFERQRDVIVTSLESLTAQLKLIGAALGEVEVCRSQVSQQRESMESDIHNAMRRLHEWLDAQATELVGQLHHLAQEKLRSLAGQRDRLEASQAQLRSCVEFVQEMLRSSRQETMSAVKSTVVMQIGDTFPSQSLKLNTETDIEFSPLPALDLALRDFGLVYLSSQPCVSKCHAKGSGLESATVGGAASTADLRLFNAQGVECKVGVDSICCELVSETSGCVVRGSVDRLERGLYKISYHPTQHGRHLLHIRIGGQHVRGSPFAVAVKLPHYIISNLMLSAYDVYEPWGVAVAHDDKIVVSENARNCISVPSASGRNLPLFEGQGSELGHFQQPRGVAVDSQGDILVCDRNNHCIQKFTSKGQFLASVGTRGSRRLQFFRLRDIAIDLLNGKLYVTDCNHRVQILNPDLSFFDTFGRHGVKAGRFDDPCGIACDGTGSVYVADTQNHRTQVFTAEGRFLRQFGRCGLRRGELSWPVGVAVDSNGVTYVSEYTSHRVSMFGSGGGGEECFGEEGERIAHPTLLTVDHLGVLYVCDSYNHRVQDF